MKKALIVKNLKYIKNGITILNEVNFEVDKGSFFIIIGPNGSGKTTLVRLITGINAPTHGKIEIMGNYIKRYNNNQLAKILAYVPQNISIDFPFKVFDIISMGRSPHLGMLGLIKNEDKKIIFEAMEIAGITNLANRMMFDLSGGEKQRVFIAKAICQQPRIIILDEPTASLDIAYQIRLMDIIKKLVQQDKMTVIMISHDINLAAMYGDNILLIKSGSVVKNGLPIDVLKTSLLEKTYGCSVLVDNSPFSNILRVTPIPGRFLKIKHNF